MKYTVTFDGRESTIYGYEPAEYVSSYLERGTFYEEPLLKYLANRYSGIRSVVDVGANIGNHSVFFHDVMGVRDITAFEPNPDNYRRVLKSLPFAKVHQVALSDKEGSVNSISHGANMGASFCTEGGDIPTATLDSYNLSPNLIKIDAENMECQVLRGALETIKRSKPVLIVEHQDIQKFYEFNRILNESGVDYLVKPFVEETWEMFEYTPIGKL